MAEFWDLELRPLAWKSLEPFIKEACPPLLYWKGGDGRS